MSSIPRIPSSIPLPYERGVKKADKAFPEPSNSPVSFATRIQSRSTLDVMVNEKFFFRGTLGTFLEVDDLSNLALVSRITKKAVDLFHLNYPLLQNVTDPQHVFSVKKNCQEPLLFPPTSGEYRSPLLQNRVTFNAEEGAVLKRYVKSLGFSLPREFEQCSHEFFYLFSDKLQCMSLPSENTNLGLFHFILDLRHRWKRKFENVTYLKFYRAPFSDDWQGIGWNGVTKPMVAADMFPQLQHLEVDCTKMPLWATLVTKDWLPLISTFTIHNWDGVAGYLTQHDPEPQYPLRNLNLRNCLLLDEGHVFFSNLSALQSLDDNHDDERQLSPVRLRTLSEYCPHLKHFSVGKIDLAEIRDEKLRQEILGSEVLPLEIIPKLYPSVSLDDLQRFQKQFRDRLHFQVCFWNWTQDMNGENVQREYSKRVEGFL